ncbi:MAG: anti-sigma factor family protein [Gemmobacter sp.]
MTRTTLMDKDRLAAFVDGEMSPEEAAEVVMHLADHPQDQAWVDDLTAANEALSQAFSAPLDEPVPDALRNLILGTAPEAKVVPFPQRATARALWAGLAGAAALAAGLAVLAFLPGAGAPDLQPGRLADGGDLHRALGSLPSGTPQALGNGTEVMILATLPTPTGFCREIEVVDAGTARLQVGLVCTEGQGWTVEVVISENLGDAGQAEGFGTAGGDEAQGFAPFLDRLGAGALLSPEDEAAAMARGWMR